MSDSRNLERPAIDDMLEALQARTRRDFLVDLLHTNGDDGAKRVDELDVGGDPEEVTVRLHHVDLPKLDELSVIEWDRDAGEVAEGARFEDIRPLVEVVERLDGERPRE